MSPSWGASEYYLPQSDMYQSVLCARANPTDVLMTLLLKIRTYVRDHIESLDDVAVISWHFLFPLAVYHILLSYILKQFLFHNIPRSRSIMGLFNKSNLQFIGFKLKNSIVLVVLTVLFGRSILYTSGLR